MACGAMRLLLLVSAAAAAACASSPTMVSVAVPKQTPAPAVEASAAVAGASADAATAAAPLVVDAAIAAAVAAPGRDPADIALDAGRKPAQILAFAGVKPGMRVAELGAGGGYTSELLARVVGPRGVVYGQNSPFLLQRFAEKPWAARLQKPVMKNVKRVDREFDDPLPEDAKDLDVVVIHLFYHDTVWMKTDRAKMNAAVFKALKPGGVYVIVDHAAAAGHGVADAQTLHRIEEKVVVDEVTAAGFVKDAEADFLKNPADAHDWNAAPRAAADKRGTSDRFALRFKKP